MSSMLVEQAVANVGTLINNNDVVEALRAALSGGKRAETLVPTILDEIIHEGAWIDRMDANGRRFTFSQAEFTRFVESPAPYGLETTKDVIRKYLGDSSNPLRVAFEELAERRPGKPHERRGEDGQFVRLHDSESIVLIPDNVRDKVDGGRSPKARDRSSEPQAGNSVGYAVRRLERLSREDASVAAIYDRLRAGEISAHAACVEAGLKSKAITIPADPAKAGRQLAGHFSPEQFDDLTRAYRVAKGLPTG